MVWKMNNPGCACCSCGQICFTVHDCGDPVSGDTVSVTLGGVSVGSGTTDASGLWCVPITSTGTYDFTISGAGHADHSDTVTVSACAPDVDPVTPTRGQHKILTGTDANPSGSYTTATTAGSTLFAAVTSNTQPVTAAPAGWSALGTEAGGPVSLWWYPNAPSTTSVSFTLGASNRWALELVEVTGLGASPTVIDAATGTATATTLALSATTGSGGNYVAAAFKSDEGNSDTFSGANLVDQAANGVAVALGYYDATPTGPGTQGLTGTRSISGGLYGVIAAIRGTPTTGTSASVLWDATGGIIAGSVRYYCDSGWDGRTVTVNVLDGATVIGTGTTDSSGNYSVCLTRTPTNSSVTVQTSGPNSRFQSAVKDTSNTALTVPKTSLHPGSTFTAATLYMRAASGYAFAPGNYNTLVTPNGSECCSARDPLPTTLNLTDPVYGAATATLQAGYGGNITQGYWVGSKSVTNCSSVAATITYKLTGDFNCSLGITLNPAGGSFATTSPGLTTTSASPYAAQALVSNSTIYCTATTQTITVTE